jgi:preprotein translocase subunit SecE
VAKAARTPAIKGRPTVAPLQGERKNYFVEVWEELKKVIWPTASELIRMTGIVIATVILFAIVIGVADYAVRFGVTNLYKPATTPKPAVATPQASPGAVSTPPLAIPSPTK